MAGGRSESGNWKVENWEEEEPRTQFLKTEQGAPGGEPKTEVPKTGTQATGPHLDIKERITVG